MRTWRLHAQIKKNKSTNFCQTKPVANPAEYTGCKHRIYPKLTTYARDLIARFTAVRGSQAFVVALHPPFLVI